jgi:hypothetical protein
MILPEDLRSATCVFKICPKINCSIKQTSASF